LSLQSLMIAELEAVKQTVKANNVALACDVHRELASFYVDNMQLPDGSVDISYLSQSVNELEDMRRVCPGAVISTEQMVRIRDGYLYLTRESRKQGYYELALQYLDSADYVADPVTFRTDQWRQTVLDERRLCYLAWIRDLLQNGDVSTAFDVSEQGDLADDVWTELSFVPRLDSVQMSLLTSPKRRRVILTLAPYLVQPAADEICDSLDVLKEALRSNYGLDAAISLGDESYAFEVVIPFEHDTDLAQQQMLLAQSLPDLPEFAFVRAVLSSEIDEIVVDDSWFVTQAFYRETVDTHEAEKEFRKQLQTCEGEFAGLEDVYRRLDASDAEMKDLILIRLQTLDLARRGWQNMIETSRAVFSLDWDPLTAGPVERTWSIQPGQAEEMRVESQSYNLFSVAVAAGLILLTVLIVILVLSLLARLR
jgi:hypothetical protein